MKPYRPRISCSGCVRAIVFSRKGGDWVTGLPFEPDSVLRMPEIDAEIPLAAVYADVELEAADTTG